VSTVSECHFGISTRQCRAAIGRVIRHADFPARIATTRPPPPLRSVARRPRIFSRSPSVSGRASPRISRPKPPRFGPCAAIPGITLKAFLLSPASDRSVGGPSVPECFRSPAGRSARGFAPPSFGLKNTMYLGALKTWQVLIPPGVGHGYKVIGETPAMLVYVTNRCTIPGRRPASPTTILPSSTLGKRSTNEISVYPGARASSEARSCGCYSTAGIRRVQNLDKLTTRAISKIFCRLRRSPPRLPLRARRYLRRRAGQFSLRGSPPGLIVNFAAESHVDRRILTPAPCLSTKPARNVYTGLKPPVSIKTAAILHVPPTKFYGSIDAPGEAD